MPTSKQVSVEAFSVDLVKRAADQPNALDGAKFTTEAITALRKVADDIAPYRRQYFRMLQAEGWSLEEIAEFVELTRARVDQILKQ